MNYGHDGFDSDDKWYVRLVALLGRRFKRMRWQQKAMLSVSVSLAALLVYWLVCRLAGFDGLDMASVRATSLYGQLPEHVEAYRWLNENERDPLVSDHVITARQSLAQTTQLVLVGSRTDEKQHVALAVDCKQIFSTKRNASEYYDALLGHTAEYLEANAGSVSCACGPMFGYTTRHLAIYLRGAHKQEAMHDEQDGRKEAVLHLLNVTDELEAAYDELNVAVLTQNNVNITVVREHQNERYNEARGEYAVIRRTRLRLEGQDTLCHRQTIRLWSELAVCAQRCLDLMRGIDVRERARMQWEAASVRLNVAAFGEPPGKAGASGVVHDEL
jgi:hypothetical protein